MDASRASGSENVRAGVRIELDDLDRRIVGILAEHGRMSNADLASRLGVAPSTAHARTRSLVERGVIAGFSAVVDQGPLGRP